MAKRWSWIPDAEHELLMRAAVDDGPDAVASWRRWKQGCSIDEIDSVGMQILPLIYRNLARLDPDDPDLGRLRGVYRYTWSRNKVLMHMGGRALQALHAEGIETMLIKGSALLASGLQPDGGARRMADFDVMVPRAHATDAIDALEALFQPQPGLPHPRQRVPVHHSAPFLDERDNELDLHWYALNRSSPDDAFWADSLEVDVEGTPTRALNPTDQLLQVCAHGAVWGPQGPLRWIADAIAITRAAEGQIDWDRLAAQATERQLTLTAAESLTYLRDEFGTEVPRECLERLEAEPRSFAERAARRASRSTQTPARMLVLHWDRYRRLRQLDPTAPRQRSFPAQLRSYWGDDTYAAFSLHTLRYLLGSGR